MQSKLDRLSLVKVLSLTLCAHVTGCGALEDVSLDRRTTSPSGTAAIQLAGNDVEHCVDEGVQRLCETFHQTNTCEVSVTDLTLTSIQNGSSGPVGLTAIRRPPSVPTSLSVALDKSLFRRLYGCFTITRNVSEDLKYRTLSVVSSTMPDGQGISIKITSSTASYNTTSVRFNAHYATGIFGLSSIDPNVSHDGPQYGGSENWRTPFDRIEIASLEQAERTKIDVTVQAWQKWVTMSNRSEWVGYRLSPEYRSDREPSAHLSANDLVQRYPGRGTRVSTEARLIVVEALRNFDSQLNYRAIATLGLGFPRSRFVFVPDVSSLLGARPTDLAVAQLSPFALVTLVATHPNHFLLGAEMARPPRFSDPVTAEGYVSDVLTTLTAATDQTKDVGRSDLNRDRVIDAVDADVLFANWGKPSFEAELADVTSDGQVDAADAAVLFANFGKSAP